MSLLPDKQIETFDFDDSEILEHFTGVLDVAIKRDEEEADLDVWRESIRVFSLMMSMDIDEESAFSALLFALVITGKKFGAMRLKGWDD